MNGVIKVSPRQDAMCIFVRPNEITQHVKEEIKQLMIEKGIHYRVEERKGIFKFNAKEYPYMGGRIAGTKYKGTIGGFVIDGQDELYALTNQHVLQAIVDTPNNSNESKDVFTATVCNDAELVISNCSDIKPAYLPATKNYLLEESNKQYYIDIGMIPIKKTVYKGNVSNLPYLYACPHYENDGSVPSVAMKELSNKSFDENENENLFEKIVYKYSSSSKKTKGMIVGVGDTVKIHENDETVICENCITIDNICKDRPISQDGDSGAIYVTESGDPVAMHFAGYDGDEEETAYAFPLKLGLQILEKATEKNLKLVAQPEGAEVT